MFVFIALLLVSYASASGYYYATSSGNPGSACHNWCYSITGSYASCHIIDGGSGIVRSLPYVNGVKYPQYAISQFCNVNADDDPTNCWNLSTGYFTWGQCASTNVIDTRRRSETKDEQIIKGDVQPRNDVSCKSPSKPSGDFATDSSLLLSVVFALKQAQFHPGGSAYNQNPERLVSLGKTMETTLLQVENSDSPSYGSFFNYQCTGNTVGRYQNDYEILARYKTTPLAAKYPLQNFDDYVKVWDVILDDLIKLSYGATYTDKNMRLLSGKMEGEPPGPIQDFAPVALGGTGGGCQGGGCL